MVEPAHGLHLAQRVVLLLALVDEHPLERDVDPARVRHLPGEEDVGESALAELLLDLEAAALDGDLLGGEHAASPVAHHLHQALRRWGREEGGVMRGSREDAEERGAVGRGERDRGTHRRRAYRLQIVHGAVRFGAVAEKPSKGLHVTPSCAPRGELRP